MESEGSLRERLIDVGVDIVMTDGPDSLGLREIARRAGVSHGAPRRYFPTHHALLSAIARRGFADLASRFEAAAEEDASPRDRVRALARTYLRYALEHRGMFELMFRHDLLDGKAQPSDLPPLRESTLPLFAHMVELVSRHTAERTAAGPATPAAVIAAALWTNLHGVAQLWAWGSLPLALGAAGQGAPEGADPLDRLLGAVLDAHLGPVNG
ncbi:TetR/AcrR family transcriptional regulator [Streptomyces sp. NPDC048332]|uniref:TetR/AcrR family transcriptional regulator n=1 Tax=Streptomyces sp. NPDC048332 TaxID=3154619 RepID=UPI00341A2477